MKSQFKFQLQEERETNNKLSRELQHNQKLNDESLEEVGENARGVL